MVLKNPSTTGGMLLKNHRLVTGATTGDASTAGTMRSRTGAAGVCSRWTVEFVNVSFSLMV
jgi:hypothetical protein